jgi:hypothetical protein
MKFKLLFAIVAMACITVSSAFITKKNKVEDSQQIVRSSEPIGGSLIEERY